MSSFVRRRHHFEEAKQQDDEKQADVEGKNSTQATSNAASASAAAASTAASDQGINQLLESLSDKRASTRQLALKSLLQYIRTGILSVDQISLRLHELQRLLIHGVRRGESEEVIIACRSLASIAIVLSDHTQQHADTLSVQALATHAADESKPCGGRAAAIDALSVIDLVAGSPENEILSRLDLCSRMFSPAIPITGQFTHQNQEDDVDEAGLSDDHEDNDHDHTQDDEESSSSSTSHTRDDSGNSQKQGFDDMVSHAITSFSLLLTCLSDKAKFCSMAQRYLPSLINGISHHSVNVRCACGEALALVHELLEDPQSPPSADSFHHRTVVRSQRELSRYERLRQEQANDEEDEESDADNEQEEEEEEEVGEEDEEEEESVSSKVSKSIEVAKSMFSESTLSHLRYLSRQAHAHHVSNRDRRLQKRVFRNVWQTFDTGISPITLINIQETPFLVKGWPATLRLAAVRSMLGIGMHTHVQHCECLRYLLSLIPVASASPSTRTRSRNADNIESDERTAAAAHAEGNAVSSKPEKNRTRRELKKSHQKVKRNLRADKLRSRDQAFAATSPAQGFWE